MKWAIQYNIFLQTEYSSLRVPKSTWQVGAVRNRAGGKDILTKAIVENAIRKLEKILEPECSQFVAATKARFLAERDNSIRRRLAAAKIQEPIMRNSSDTPLKNILKISACTMIPKCG